MKVEERTEFMIDWGEGQHLRVHEGLAMATTLLRGGPLPFQVGITSTSYMALGGTVPSTWLSLFDKALDPSAFEAEISYHSRVERGFLHQVLSLGPCEHGEHLHANVVVTYLIVVDDADTPDTLSEALYEAWREVGDRMSELQDEWVHPFLDEALEIENLHKS